ncbi:hypothetical protein BP5796_02256 [Coleophoma crateriformis]|uniref:Small ribosomal subunit protein bS18m n=1 Tax=Coleophoma crateriformis TaxID=565419 RepID=A0A3D8SY41_9HELO|nr:hypothetical protein BP5796_02256 [Coleophoma crateriformis]
MPQRLEELRTQLFSRSFFDFAKSASWLHVSEPQNNLRADPPLGAASLLANVSGERERKGNAASRSIFSNASSPIKLPNRTGRKRGLEAGNTDSSQVALNQVQSSYRARQAAMKVDTPEEIKAAGLAADLSRQITRRWRAGDVYAPHDLSDVEMAKWKRRSRPEYDAFDVLDMDPLMEYKNFSMLSEYMTTMGRIKPRAETGLRPVNQRRIAKAIRRSIGMGMMPSVHRHPEILQKSIQRNTQISPSLKGPQV